MDLFLIGMAVATVCLIGLAVLAMLIDMNNMLSERDVAKLKKEDGLDEAKKQLY